MNTKTQILGIEVEDTNSPWYEDGQEVKIRRLYCIKCGDPTLDEGQSVSMCGNCI